ncbi:IS1-like element transposase, partial [Escherichia coli]|nr:IS1-like element transposase [Escherichia coli]
MATVTVHCPRCNSDKVYRHGRSCSQHERFRCRSCKRVFQLTYSYEARKPGFKELIVEMAHNGTGAVGNDSNLLIVFYVQIMPDDFVMQLHR